MATSIILCSLHCTRMLHSLSLPSYFQYYALGAPMRAYVIHMCVSVTVALPYLYAVFEIGKNGKTLPPLSIFE